MKSSDAHRMETGDVRITIEDEVTVRAEMAERKKQFVIHPHGSFRKGWLMLMLLATVVNVVMTPLGVSFFTDTVQESTAWIVFNVIADCIFILDLALSFRTGYTNEEDVVVLDLRLIRNRYLKSWFIVDLLAVMPVDYCFLISRAVGALAPSAAGYSGVRIVRMMKLMRLFALLRLLRLSRLLRYARYWEETHGWDVGGIDVVLRSVFALLLIFVICHWNACFQFLAADLMGFEGNTWVALDGLIDQPISRQYTKAMFRALCHIMTLNYGSRGVPKATAEIWVVIVSMLVGSVMYALILAKMIALSTESGTSERMFDRKHNELKEYLRHHHLPNQLRGRVLEHLENTHRGKWFDEDAILKDLSEPLRQAVIAHNCETLVSGAAFFRDAEPLFLSALLAELQSEMYHTGDVIQRKGAVGQCAYFLQRGTVLVEAADFRHTLGDGAFFGELCLLSGGRRGATVTALTPCRVYRLPARGYRKLLARFPEEGARVQQAARERLEALRGGGQLSRAGLSELGG